MKKIVLILSVGLALACNTMLITPTPSPTATDTAILPPVATNTVMPTLAPDTATPEPAELTMSRVWPSGGPLKNQLAVEAGKAFAAGQIPVIEFDAMW